ncbi:PilW family protein [Cellulomonas sp. P5_E12]
MRRRDRRDERGTSLAELLVTMMILSVVIAATATLTIGFQRTNAQSIGRQNQIDVARAASERLSKVVRTAVKPSQLVECVTSACDDLTAFIAASGTGMQFYANLNNGGNTIGASRVTYSVGTTAPDVGVLVEKVQIPDHDSFGKPILTSTGYTYCNAEVTGAPAACKANLKVTRVATGVVTTPTAPLFSYFDELGQPMVVAPGAALTNAQIGKVLSIELNVKVQLASKPSVQPTTYIQRILLPNSQAVLRPGDESTP